MHKLLKNYWAIATIILAILLVISLISNYTSEVSKSTAGQKIVDFAKEQGVDVKIISVDSKGDLYQVNIEVQGKPSQVYITKDGKNAIFQLVPLESQPTTPTNTPTQEKKQIDIPKTDKPTVDLFVMTYCPYGTQAEKGIIPAIEAIANKASVNIRFVHYFMHGDKEEQETYRQICIREEQNEKFLPYLKCFLNASDSEGCIKSTNVDSAKLGVCITDKAKTYYAADSELSNKYGVQGSPTMVINGVQAEFYPRDPTTALKTVCATFNKAPDSECGKALSTANPSPGFGYSASNGNSAASCGT